MRLVSCEGVSWGDWVGADLSLPVHLQELSLLHSPLSP